MKHIQKLALVLCVALAVLPACSPDRVERQQEEATEEWSLTPEPIPEPDWADGTMTISIGEYDDNQHLLQVLEQAKNTTVHVYLRIVLEKNLVKLERKTIEIAVVTLLEAGFNEPVTREEIRERFRELGYRPLTIQEAIELRLQLQDQPGTETGHRMSAFFVLFSEEDDKLLRLSEGICLAIYRNTIRDRIGEGYGIAALKQPKKIDPLRPEINFVAVS